CLLRHIGEGAIAIVAVEHVLAVVADKEIVPAVVVVVANAAALTPSCSGEPCFEGDVDKGAVAIILEEVRDGLLPLSEPFKPRAVDQEDIDPVVVVIVVEGYAATSGLEEISVLVFAAV